MSAKCKKRRRARGLFPWRLSFEICPLLDLPRSVGVYGAVASMLSAMTSWSYAPKLPAAVRLKYPTPAGLLVGGGSALWKGRKPVGFGRYFECV